MHLRYFLKRSQELAGTRHLLQSTLHRGLGVRGGIAGSRAHLRRMVPLHQVRLPYALIVLISCAPLQVCFQVSFDACRQSFERLGTATCLALLRSSLCDYFFGNYLLSFFSSRYGYLFGPLRSSLEYPMPTHKEFSEVARVAQVRLIFFYFFSPEILRGRAFEQ